MTRRRLISSIGTVVATLLLTSCNTVTIKDEAVIALRGPGLGAIVVHTLTTEELDLEQQDLDKVSAGLLCLTAAGFGDFKSIIEQLCSYHPTECQYVVPVMDRLSTVQKKIRKHKP